MLAEKKNPVLEDDEVFCRLISREEAAERVSSGTLHLHSSTLGENDVDARISKSILGTGNFDQRYSWELVEAAKSLPTSSSADRQTLIKTVIEGLEVKAKKGIIDRVQTVLEELLSNAFFHSYRREDGTRKFNRSSVATLSNEESLSIKYASNDQGIYLCVDDQGGSLTFDSIRSSLRRCYKKEPDQIESKESGAGLGFYMMFEAITHLRVDVEENKRTSVSCWISSKHPFDRDIFSFNFFRKG